MLILNKTEVLRIIEDLQQELGGDGDTPNEYISGQFDILEELKAKLEKYI